MRVQQLTSMAAVVAVAVVLVVAGVATGRWCVYRSAYCTYSWTGAYGTRYVGVACN